MENFKSLEFNLIKIELEKYAKLSFNKDRLLNLKMLTSKEEIIDELSKTDEASRIIKGYGSVIVNEINDLNIILQNVEKGGVLLIDELYDIKSLLTMVKENVIFSSHIKEKYNFFSLYINKMNECSELYNLLDKTIIDKENIYDNASISLNKIRHEIKKLENSIKEKLLSIISTNANILTDTNILYKNGKQVLSVKSSDKYKLKGVVVEESSSGYTSYIEPEIVYRITSQISILKVEERKEIHRILESLTKVTNNYVQQLKDNYMAIINLDYMFAKGEYCNNINGVIASISDTQISLINAKHPLIDKDKVIGNNFNLLDNNKKMLLISGANTGGKSVALKTIGLLSYMNQCGLGIPCDKAVLPIFDNIFVDIGDNQSIMSSLSTFSSHVNNIANILNKITSKSLVILDEVGAGTEPNCGESLAMAIIDYCHKKDCYLVTSTHYDNLKTFAINQEYISISSMEFDKQNLKPTYRLREGEISSSYAFEIAYRYGLDDEIITRAKKYKEEYANETQKMLSKLEMKINEQNEIINEYNKKEKELNELIKENKLREQVLNNEIEKIKENAEKEIEILVGESKEYLNQIIENIKNNNNPKLHEVLIAKGKLKNILKEDSSNKKIEEIFEIGDNVTIISLKKNGIITSKNKSKYGVNIGNLTINVASNDLQKRVNVSKKNKVIINSKIKNNKVSMELNLVGKRVEAALLELDAYIDKAKIMHFPSVRIIHGYGEGKLQKAIHEYLKKIDNIYYHFGGEHDGGMGSTIIEFGKKVN